LSSQHTGIAPPRLRANADEKPDRPKPNIATFCPL